MKILTFGEIMLRLKTPEYLRIVQANGFEASYGGAESNVAVSLSTLGDDAAFLTKLPDNPVGNAAFNELLVCIFCLARSSARRPQAGSVSSWLFPPPWPASSPITA